MEILHKELGYVETFMKKDPNLSTLDGLVHFAAELAIQIKSLEVACDNWDATLKITLELHNFLKTNILLVYNLLTSVSKRRKEKGVRESGSKSKWKSKKASRIKRTTKCKN